MNRCQRFPLPAFPLVGLLCLAMGCGKGPVKQVEQDPEKAHIMQVSALVSEYMAAHRKPAKNIDELQAWALKAHKATDEDFVSTRDQEPYMLVGDRVREKTGKNGKVFVAGRGGAAEADREKADQMENDQTRPGPPPGVRR